MAELHVQEKRSKPWWLWLLLALVVIGVLYFLLRDKDATTDNNTEATTGTGATTALIFPAGLWPTNTVPFC